MITVLFNLFIRLNFCWKKTEIKMLIIIKKIKNKFTNSQFTKLTKCEMQNGGDNDGNLRC